jgi:outer membrane lipoprotein-sorting protein
MTRTFSVVLLIALALPTVIVAGPAPTIQGDPAAVAEYVAAFQKFSASSTYRSKMSSAQGALNMEVVRPDRMRFAIQGGQFVRIANATWTIVSGQCTRVPSSSFRMPNPEDYAQQDSDSTIQVTKTGAEAVEGDPTLTYNVVVTSKGKTGRQKVYVATQTGYPRRIEASSPEGNATIDYWDFNANITIEPPC